MARKSQVRMEYEKELKRVQNIVKRGIKKGITFTESPIPETPKRVTRKRVEELKELTYREIWSKGYQIDTDTGEVSKYSPYEASKQAHKKAQETIKRRKELEKEIDEYDKRKVRDELNKYDYISDDGKIFTVDTETGEVINDIPAEDDEIIQNIEEAISGGTNPDISSLVYEVLQSEINSVGKKEVAKRISEAPLNVRTLAEDTAFAFYLDDIRENALALIEIITGGNVTDSLRRSVDESAWADRPYKPKNYSTKQTSGLNKRVYHKIPKNAEDFII